MRLELTERDTGHGLPDFVVKEFDDYLQCGILAHGFLRAKCESCHHEMLVAFSCKRRGFCPSCAARRMSETSIHLVDSVLPHRGVRQWVATFPVPIRLCFAVQPKIMARALDIVISAISAFYRKKTGLTKNQAKTGAVTIIQRFGGSLNVNIHFHALFIDGCYELANKQPKIFHPNPTPAAAEVEEVLRHIITRITRYLQRQGIITKDEDFQLPIDDEDTFTKLQASSATYRFATGPRKGQKAFQLKTAPDADHITKAGLVARLSGFSLHAGVAARADERVKIERIARYIARPAISEDRLSLGMSGQVIYRFKKPWDDGTAAISMTPLEFMERLAALVPRPRVHLTRYSGVLAPHYKYRKDIVPKPQPEATISEQNSEPKDESSCKQSMHWARLLKRVFGIDVETCAKCGGKIRIIATIEDPRVIRKILDHLGLPPRPPIIHGPRGPPQTWHSENSEFDMQLLPD